MSGYADLKDASVFGRNNKLIKVEEANNETIHGLGRFIDVFSEVDVSYNKVYDADTKLEIIIPREETYGKFLVWREKEYFRGVNGSVNSGEYDVCRVIQHRYGREYCCVREVNFHPECSQIIFPCKKEAFILVLGQGNPNDEISLKALLFDGTKGFEIFPRVWHQPPIANDLVFDNKQGKSHICVVHDFVNSNGSWVCFPNVLEKEEKEKS